MKKVHVKKIDVDMTDGGIFRHLIIFALPLLAGNLFQQIYNMVDTWVVGNYVSNEAFSAVGADSPVINMLIGFFMGLSSGAGVVISQYYGAKRFDMVEKATHTALAITAILAVLFTAIGIVVTPLMLNFMKIPPEVFPEAKLYLSIYFSGIAGLLIYNMGSAILRAVGNSSKPFYFLAVSAVINVGLDLLFVLVFNMGVDGVAYATIISQAVSAALIIIELMRTDSCVQVRLKKLAVNKDILISIIKVGLPAGLQMAITAFSNVFVQSYINHFGADCMSGWTAYNRVDQLVLLPMQSVSLAATTFVGQNLGTGKVERAKKGVRVSFAVSAVTTAALLIPMYVFAPQIIAFFNDKPEVVAYGTLILRLIIPFNMFGCVNHTYAGALRGSGNSRAPMVIMLVTFVLLRQIYLFITANYIANEIVPIAFGYPLGWILCAITTLLYYKKTSPIKAGFMEKQELKAGKHKA